MISRVFYIPQHRWVFRVYVYATCYWTDEILRQLVRLGAGDDHLRQAEENLRSCSLNTGLTYASGQNRETLMVVAKTTTAAELFNSVVHEIDHAAMFTFPLLGITPGTEEAAYFKGGLARDVFPIIQPYLCDCCRRKRLK